MTKLIDLLLCIFILSFKCGTYHSSSIRAVTIIATNRVSYYDTKIAVDNLLNIYYYKDLVMFEYPYRYDSVVNGKILFTENRKAFFVFQKDSSYGYHYDGASYHTMPNNERLSVDSVREKHHSSNYDIIMSWKPDSVTFDSANKMLREVYYYPQKRSDSVYYTYILCYSTELSDIKETLSKKLDSSRNAKLFKVFITNNEDTALLKRLKQSKIVVNEQIKRNNEIDEKVNFYFKKYEATINHKKNNQIFGSNKSW
jgi:hypothetical protein